MHAHISRTNAPQRERERDRERERVQDDDDDWMILYSFL